MHFFHKKFFVFTVLIIIFSNYHTLFAQPAATDITPTILHHFKIFNAVITHIPLLKDAYHAFKEYRISLSTTAKEKAIKELIEKNQAHDCVAKDLQDEIRSIFKECKLEDSNAPIILENKDLNNPAVVIGDSILIISQPQFQKLTPALRRTVIGHEAMHIKHRDARRIFIFALLLPLLVEASVHLTHHTTHGLISKMFPSRAETIKIIATLIFHSFPIKLVVADLFNAAYNRSIEKQADLQAAKALNNAADFITFFNNKTGDESFFALHPSFKERITYFERALHA